MRVLLWMYRMTSKNSLNFCNFTSLKKNKRNTVGVEKVDKHISDLLYDHDCVIVPQLGGFVANYASAKIHPTQHTFTPPSKNIVFNTNLKNNDGLLANHIAQFNNTSYPEALKYIHHFVDETTTQLKEGKKVKISDVGKLFLDVERNIQFEPDTNSNHLLDAFGLAQFQSPAINRGSIGKRIEKEFIDRQPIPVGKKKINIKRYVALAIAMPMIFAMVWIPLKTDLLKNINYSNLNPFASKEKSKYTPTEPLSTVELKAADFEEAPLIDNTDTAKYKSVQLTENSTTSVTIKAFSDLVEPVKADSTNVSLNTTVADASTGFHIVAGCFLVQENAVNFVEKLKQQNLNAAIIGKNDKDMYVVSCGDYTTRDVADKELLKFRNKGLAVWLYKN